MNCSTAVHHHPVGSRPLSFASRREIGASKMRWESRWMNPKGWVGAPVARGSCAPTCCFTSLKRPGENKGTLLASERSPSSSFPLPCLLRFSPPLSCLLHLPVSSNPTQCSRPSARPRPHSLTLSVHPNLQHLSRFDSTQTRCISHFSFLGLLSLSVPPPPPFSACRATTRYASPSPKHLHLHLFR